MFLVNKGIGFQPAEIEKSISDRLESIVNQFPERIAISSQGVQITYGMVNQTANTLARTLLDNLGEGNEPVVLLLDHDTPMLIAIVGVLKAGKAYVVLEPNLPPGRLKAILADLQPRLIISNNQHWDLAITQAGDSCRLINLDALNPDVSGENLGLSISADTVAAIFYTSGSTGRPKGVQWNHRGILHRIWLETNDYHILPEDKIVLLYSCGFGASVADIFNALLNGATLCLYDFKKEGLAGLSNWLRQEEITIFHLPVALFQQWLNSLDAQENFPTLRQVTPSGKLYRKDVERCWQYFSETCTLVQRYSSTEAGMCTRFIIDPQTSLLDPVVSIGYPIADKEIFLVKEGGQPVTDESIGEIAVKSRYLSLGYWRNCELTSQKFLCDPDDIQTQIYLTGDLGRWRSDGSLEYLERKDFMVKIRGYRVEPSEVETALFELEIVQQAVVIAYTEADRETCLIAYVVPAGQHSSISSLLYQMLREKIPNYMMPTAFVILAELPLTPNGKIDRQSLPAPNLSERAINQEFVAPRTPVEEKLCRIWCDLLKLEQVSIHDNFFELGGHSLLATQIVSRIKEVFSLDSLPLGVLFQAPTVEKLAEFLRIQLEDPGFFKQKKHLQNYSSLIPIQPDGSLPPLFFIHVLGRGLKFCQPLARYLNPDLPIYGLNAQIIDKKLAPPNQVEDLAAFYIKEMRTLQPEGPYFLAGISFGGKIAYEMAQQLRSQDQNVAFLALLDTIVPSALQKLPLKEKVSLHWRNFSEVGFPYILTKSDEKIRGTIQKFQLNLSSLYKRFYSRLALKLGASLSEEMQDFIFQQENSHASIKYFPNVYLGKVTLFCAKERKVGTSYSIDPQLGWRELAAGGLEIQEIPGDHLGMLQEPSVLVLAEKFQACIDKSLEL